jgi:xeroderma pigmentosum group C-complementing protein
MRGTIRKKNQFEPASDNGPIRMAYVLAFEEGTSACWTIADDSDGYAREVTLRYTKSFGAKTSKLRVPVKKDEPDWLDGLLGHLTRPYRLVSLPC